MEPIVLNILIMIVTFLLIISNKKIWNIGLSIFLFLLVAVILYLKLNVNIFIILICFLLINIILSIINYLINPDEEELNTNPNKNNYKIALYVLSTIIVSGFVVYINMTLTMEEFIEYKKFIDVNELYSGINYLIISSFIIVLVMFLDIINERV